MPSDPNRPNRWWIAPVLGVVVVVTAVLALVAHNLYQQQPAASPPVVVSTGSVSVPIGAEPGSGKVSVTPDVLRDPLHTDVVSVLQTYFDAINGKKYAQWRSVVTPNLASQEPESAFQQGYESTKDGSITVYRVDTAPDGGLRVLLSFTSTQSIADAPKSFPHTCIVWHVVWPMSLDDQDGTWRVDAGTTDLSPQWSACPVG